MSHITTVEISTQKRSKQRASEVTELQILSKNEGLVCACPHSFWEDVKKWCLAAEHVGLRSSLYLYEYGEWDAADGWSFPLCELKIESVEAFQIKKCGTFGILDSPNGARLLWVCVNEQRH